MNIDTNDAIYHQCDIGYIHLRERLERPILSGVQRNPPSGVDEQI